MRKLIVYIALIALVATLISTALTPTLLLAEETEYSNVLTDLEKDESFDETHYPTKANDYSLDVIQIAESVDKELFVYVYQPSGNAVQASSINVSLTIYDEVQFRNYKLRYINSDGVFFKYKVEGIVVSTLPMRYYSISSIYRRYDKNVDKPVSGGNTVSEVPYSVAKQYCFGTLNGQPYCSVVDIETIEITEKFVGYVQYSNGFELWTASACHSHFVAFDTDRRMDKLLEVDVEYTAQKYIRHSTLLSIGDPVFDPKSEPILVELNHKQWAEHKGDGWGAGTYNWKRIETVDEFIAENTGYQNVYSGAIFDVNIGNRIDPDAETELKKNKWVLRFCETEYKHYSDMGTGYYDAGTIIGDVSLLRLKFETDGLTYNLGVIDNKQSGSDKPINDENTFFDPAEWLQNLWDKMKETFDKYKWIVYVVIAIVILMFISPFIPMLIKATLWIVCLPFRLIGAIFGLFKKKNKNKKE